MISRNLINNDNSLIKVLFEFVLYDPFFSCFESDRHRNAESCCWLSEHCVLISSFTHFRLFLQCVWCDQLSKSLWSQNQTYQSPEVFSSFFFANIAVGISSSSHSVMTEVRISWLKFSISRPPSVQGAQRQKLTKRWLTVTKWCPFGKCKHNWTLSSASSVQMYTK